MEKTLQQKNETSNLFNIGGISLGVFSAVALVVLAAVYTGTLPKGMIGALAVMITFGAVMEKIGDNMPLVKDYMGGAPMVAIFGTAVLVYYNIMPQGTNEIITEFMKGGGFLNFYIAALITGSILGMKSDLLVKAGSRFLVPLFGGVVVSFLFAAGLGAVIGYGWKEGILQIAMPIMGGGMGAGAVPMAQIYNQFLQMDTATILSILVPALALGNVFSIIGAALLDKLGKIKPNLSGNGQLMAGFEFKTEAEEKYDIKLMGIGLSISLTFFILGIILNMFIPAIHSYALMILSVAIIKVAGVMPKQVERGANQWYQFVAKNFTMALLVGIGVAYTNLGDVISAVSINYVLLVAVVVLGAVVGAGLFGKLVGFNPIESAITAGLCMANMGGTGDVAVLSASKRMELMPFAQISSRIGGAIILLIASFLLPLL